ncbi:MAG TPA: pyridoxamine 5'-phosphate oxidase family protein [Candidatus Omnitrophota bacterium]|nr:pyridoxamine 5'-phosphate oxidase family protein [Candidatus Omnitrophota bacterium]MDD5422943.1 pyridoxamine 5'-phosphate oxidase family protein [Candidatus Omnitrophota bacterium]HOX09416.1 pyridoxamine 5'-phosphate oxidase family protein [Candidatus Omnitrophota bacterium]
MIAKKINELIKDMDFVQMATCDMDGRPNVAPKFFLKAEGGHIYMVDFVIGRTFRNLNINPKASISVVDYKNLTGYQVNGAVEILSEGAEYEKAAKEFLDKEIRLSTKRIVEGVKKGERHNSFEAAFPNRIVVFKVSIDEAVEICPGGELKKEGYKGDVQ